MGISGLLGLLKSIQRPTELKNFAGETLAVDAYIWLHRGTVSCAIELALGKPTRKYVDFAMSRVRMVKHFGVTPYMVFDGDMLGSKLVTESSRAKSREAARKAGLELLKAGKTSQAHQELQKAVEVTPEMARAFIEELKKAGVPYLVAPYEADPQLVYLERQGLVSGIVSEDSDLLVFGAKRLLTKLDQYGQCVEINRRDFAACREVSLTNWTDKDFRHMAILAGCDYLPGIGQMGLKSAHRLIRKYKTAERVIRMVQFDGKFRVPQNFLAGFQQADLTFLYQRVFCPVKQELVCLAEPDPDIAVDAMPFLGAKVDPVLARAIAVGDVNPITKQPMVLPPQPAGRGDRRNAHSTPVQTPPAGKPIDSYFTGPERISLGAMDPNCFSIAPRQVAALTQNGLAPVVFPLPRPYLDSAPDRTSRRPYTAPTLRRRRTEPISNLLELPNLNTATARGAATRIGDRGSRRMDGTGPHARPPKKARLCDDPTTQGGGEVATLEKSKFFPSKTIKTPADRTRCTEAILMSDDSIEEALLELPDLDSWNSIKSTKSCQPLSIHQDDTRITIPDSPGPELAVCEDDEVVRASDVEVPATSPIAVRPIEATTGDGLLVGYVKPSLSRFAYSPLNLKKGRGVTSPIPTPSWSATGTGSEPLRAATPVLTPLQRIGQRALRTRRGTPSASKSVNAIVSLPRPGLEILAFPVNPSFVPLPKVDLDEVAALNQSLGSEDLIIPDSDGENDQLQVGQWKGARAQGSPVGRFDLSRFLHR